jgi:hypothetical protein
MTGVPAALRIRASSAGTPPLRSHVKVTFAHASVANRAFISDRFSGTYSDVKADYHTVEYDFAEQFIRHVVEQMYLVECFIFEQGMLGEQIPFKRIEYPEIIARGPALVFEKPDETLLIIELFHLANGKYINSDEVIVERDHQQYYLRLVPIPEATQFQQITG